MKQKFYKVYYRCKVNGNGKTYAVSGKTNRRQAALATHVYMPMKERGGHYAPVVFEISEKEFNEHKHFNQGREHIRW